MRNHKSCSLLKNSADILRFYDAILNMKLIRHFVNTHVMQ